MKEKAENMEIFNNIRKDNFYEVIANEVGLNSDQKIDIFDLEIYRLVS